MADQGEFAVAGTLGMLAEALPAAPATVCEVGAGRGALAAALVVAGYEVTALEPDPVGAAAARSRGVRVAEEGLLEHRGGPYDVVLFTRSLHHIEPLGGAVDRALDLLRPGGRLVLEEFARDRADRLAASFLYDTFALLYAAGLLVDDDEPGAGDDDESSAGDDDEDAAGAGAENGAGGAGGNDEIRGTGEAGRAGAGGRHAHRGRRVIDAAAIEPSDDPWQRWEQHFRPEPDRPLHAVGEILAVLKERGLTVTERTTPALWRMLVHDLKDVPEAGEIARRLRAIETRRIDEGTLPATGVVLTAVPAGT
jgi:SAM-dependent methyltransferase